MCLNRDTIEQGIQDKIVKEQVMTKLKRAGLYIPPKPDETVNLYTEWDNLKRSYGGIANIPFNELGDFLDRWSGMIAYTRWVEAIADLEQITAREIKETIRKQLYTIQEGSRELRDASVYTESIYIEWENKFIEAYALYIAVKALREGYEQRLNAISREITRRGSDILDTRRTINRGNTP